VPVRSHLQQQLDAQCSPPDRRLHRTTRGS
jgi:hypothetical protein